MVEVITPRLLIHRASKEDTSQISEMNSAVSTTAYLKKLSAEDIDLIFRDKEAVDALLARLAATLGDGAAISYGAWIGSEMIGYVTLHNCDGELPDLQIEISPSYQGKGYGYEFLSALIDHLFMMGYNKFRYAVVPNNVASIALVEKIGGVLQQPESEAERLLLRTYHISRQ